MIRSLIQFSHDGQRSVAGVDEAGQALCIAGVATTLELAIIALNEGTTLAAAAAARTAAPVDLAGVTILSPIDHADPAHCVVSGTGLTHLGSAEGRDKMHKAAASGQATDSMRMFLMGLEGGKPADGATGVQPEWFYKGDGSILVAPDALGPELLLGELPADVRGTSRIIRDGAVLWEKPFVSGEANMSHSLANLEHHHFKYAQFCRPGDVHVHFFGTATLSFSDGIATQAGDVFEITGDAFTLPLRNPLAVGQMAEPAKVRSL
jgi:hypothetical protein